MKLATGQIAGFLDRPTTSVRVFLVYGPDDGLVHERAKALAAKLSSSPPNPFAVSVFSGAALAGSASTLLDEMSAIPFGGGRRLLRVHQPTEALAGALGDFLKTPPPGDSAIIIEAGDLDKRSKLRALCEGDSPLAAAIPCYQEDMGGRMRALSSLFDAEKIRAPREVISLLADILPPDRLAMRSEMNKLVLYLAGQDQVTLDDVRAIIADAGGAESDDFIMAVAGGDVRKSQSLLDHLYAEQASPVALLRAMQRHLMRLHQAGFFMEQGAGAEEALKKLSPPVFWKLMDPMKKQLHRWSLARIEKRLSELMEAEAALKRTGTPDIALCAQLFLSIAARP